MVRMKVCSVFRVDINAEMEEKKGYKLSLIGAVVNCSKFFSSVDNLDFD